MKVKCPKCDNQYNLQDDRIPDAGHKMRCPNCSTSFLVKKASKTLAFDQSVGADPSAGGDNPLDDEDVGTELDLRESEPSSKINLPPIPSIQKEKKGTIAFGAPMKKETQAMGSIDLPAPKKSIETKQFENEADFGEIDLPGFAESVDLPAPTGQRKPLGGSAGDELDLIDLPALQDDASDLPAPKKEAARPKSSSFNNVDLPTPASGIAAPSPSTGSIDLPTPAGGIDLPTPAGGIDLPTPAGGIDLPTPAGGIDLPTPASGTEGLPTPANVVDLPSPASGIDLPTPSSGTEGLPTPANVVDLPSPADALGSGSGDNSDPFGEIDLSSAKPPPIAGDSVKSDPSLPPLGSLDGGAFPSVDDGTKLPSIEPLKPHETDDASSPISTRVQSSEFAEFGEVDLMPATESLDGQSSPELDIDDDELTDISSQRDTQNDPTRDTGIDLALDPRDLDRVGIGMEGEEQAADLDEDGRKPAMSFSGRRKYERQSRKAKLVLLLVLVIVCVAGGLLSFTDYGPFGANKIAKMLPQGTNKKLVKLLKDNLLRKLAADKASGIDQSQKEILDAAEKNSVDEDLKLLGVYAYHWDQIRFGMDKKNNHLAAKLLGSVNLKESESQYASLVLASQSLLARKFELIEKQLTGPMGGSAEGLSLLVIAYLDAGRGDKAVSSAKKLAAVEQTPRTGYLLGRALIQSGAYKDAAKHLATFIERFPKHHDSTLGYAEALANINPLDKEKIRSLVEPIIGKDPMGQSDRQKAQGHAILARLHVVERRYADAKKEIETALALDPKNLFALIDRGEVAIKQEDLSTAAISFKQALAKSPINLSARLGQIETTLLEGNLTAAKEVLEPIFQKHVDNARVHFLMAEIQRALKESDEAFKGYQKAIALNKEFLEAYIALSEYYIESKQRLEAMKILDKASEAVPDSTLISQALADAHAAGRDFPSAIIELSKAIDIDPNDPLSHFKMGQMYRKMDSLDDDAKMAFDEVEKLDSSFPGLSMERGFLMELSGETASALAVYKKALAANTDDYNLKIRVAAASHMLGDQATAEQLLIDVIGNRPDSAEVNFFLGEVYRVTDRPVDAVRHLGNAKRLSEKSALYHLRYGMALKDAQKTSEAMEAFQTALKLDPDLAEIHLRIGQIRLKHGAAKTAIEAFDKALALDPELYEAYEFVADAFEQLSDTRSAVAYYRKAAKALPENAEIFFKLGLAELNATGRKLAIPALTQAVKLGDKGEDSPSWLPEAMYHLGSAQHSAGMNSGAIKTFKRYLEISPANHIDRTEVLAQLERLEN